jgi:hypothetical protein
MTKASKSSSHKAHKKTRSSVTKDIISAKKKLDLTTPDDALRPAVSQTQDEAALLVLPSLPVVQSPQAVIPLHVPITDSHRLRRSLGSPLADDEAIAEMISGLPLRRLAFEEVSSANESAAVPVVTQTGDTVDNMIDSDLNDEAQLDAYLAVVHGAGETEGRVDPEHSSANFTKMKKKKSKVSAFKLTAQSVHNPLRDTTIAEVKKHIENGVRKKANPYTSLKTSLNFFQTQTYTAHVSVASGKSRRLATKKARASNIVPDIVYEALEPTFDFKKASKAAPNIPWNDIVPSFNLDSKKLRRYIVEDVMYSNPASRERLLLLVCMQSPDFQSTFLKIYNQQRPLRPPIQFGKQVFVQIEAEVIKNAFRNGFMHGLHDVNTVKYLLTKVGGGGIGVHFPSCSDAFNIELKFSTIIENCSTFQVWGMAKSGRDFKPSIRNLKNEASREACFTRYCEEVYGDHASSSVEVFPNGEAPNNP